MTIKLLQDIANEMHEADCPRYMFCLNDADGLLIEGQMKRLATGSEANVYESVMGGRPVAIRVLVPLQHDSETFGRLMYKVCRGAEPYRLRVLLIYVFIAAV